MQLPTMTLAGAMVMKAKLDSNLAVSTVALGVLFVFVSMPIFLGFVISSNYMAKFLANSLTFLRSTFPEPRRGIFSI